MNGDPATITIPGVSDIHLAADELQFSFILASGPGGQKVNKSATAVQLRFNVDRSASLPEPVRLRLRQIAGNRINRDGELVITAREHRTQARNRQAAVERLVALIRKAAHTPKRRIRTRPSKAAKQRRVDDKRRRGERKRGRRAISDE